MIYIIFNSLLSIATQYRRLTSLLLKYACKYLASSEIMLSLEYAINQQDRMAEPTF